MLFSKHDLPISLINSPDMIIYEAYKFLSEEDLIQFYRMT